MSFKQRLQLAIDNVFEPSSSSYKFRENPEKKFSIEAYKRNNECKNIEVSDINSMTLKVMRNNNKTQNKSVCYTETSEDRPKNRMKEEAINFVGKSTKTKGLQFNRPLVLAENLNFDRESYLISSPNTYKKNYYVSNFCRKYQSPKNVHGIFEGNTSTYNRYDNYFQKYEKQVDNEKISFKTLYNSRLFKEKSKSIVTFPTYTRSKSKNNGNSRTLAAIREMMGK